jgi:hypothetical protein
MSDKSGSDSEPEEDYEVEEIRDKRRGEDGEWLYYVKWVGWESDTNTWEPVEHLDECKEKLLDFERTWRRKQEKKERRRREEREQKLKERREKELKNAARLKVDIDDGGYGQERKKEKKKIVSDSSSDSEGEKKKKNKDREREREKSKKHKRDKERKREGGDLFKAEGHSSKKKEEAPKKEVKPKYFRDIKPEKILGVTSDLGEVHFYIKWEGGKSEPGLVTAKEAYQKIPQMCLKFYESHLVWDKKEAKKVEKDATLTKEKVSVPEKVVRRESVESKSSETSKGESKERPSSSLSKGEPSQEVPPPPSTNPDSVVATPQPTPVE